MDAKILCKENNIFCQGNWSVNAIADLQSQFNQLVLPQSKTLALDGSELKKLDTAGAWYIKSLMALLEKKNITVTIIHFQVEYVTLIEQTRLDLYQELPKPEQNWPFLARLGLSAHSAYNQALAYLSFVGELTSVFINWLKHPKRIRWISINYYVDVTGPQAIPIIALLSFLIGVVLAYQVGLQLRDYGASVYVVDLMGISILREFAPLLTAIIVAGRSGSAFAAQIGTMKLNEEVDALQTMGLSPVEVLVLPKFLALIIALPLLTVLSCVFGIFGGMVMVKPMLGIGYIDFLHRFAEVIALKMLVLGEIKTPIFAAIIASIGCFQGFQVSNSAASVGARTTTSVVQSIFMIIVADAAFSILYSWLDL